MRSLILSALALAVVFELFPLVAAADSRAVPRDRAEMQLSFAPVVRRASPAVVNIYTRRVVTRRQSPFAGDPFFDRFFRDFAPPRQSVENSLGSGVILREDGVVVTNAHVIAGAVEIRVALADRREFDAEVMLADEATDLAVLRLRGASDLPTLDLRPADTLEVGDLVLAIGNPFGVGQTVTSGIVSAVDRVGRRGGGYFIQTDAAINPGNSGGALVDMEGRLVGVNTAILSRGGGSIGIGFAIPSDLAAQAVDSALRGETRLVRPWAGVRGQAVDAGIAASLGFDRPAGVILSEIHPQSPFAEAGLRVGDVLLTVDGAPVDSPQALSFRLAALGVGGEVEVRYLRRASERTARVALVPPPAAARL